MLLSSPMIGIVGLSEAGNLGDDLILLATVQAVGHACPDSSILHLAFGSPVDWAHFTDALQIQVAPQSVSTGRDLPGTRKRSRTFADADAIVFGGGGLLQTSHDPNRPYHWLSYLPEGITTKVMAVGLGIGPLDANACRWLRDVGMPFDRMFVRDPDSAELAINELDWRPELSHDFIDSDFLSQILNPVDQRPGHLGVALRAWPGLEAARLAQEIDTITRQYSISKIEFFVLESKSGAGVDVDFTNEVDSLRSTVCPSTIEVYAGKDPIKFAQKMIGVERSLSMKLHSSAIWTSSHIPVHPVIYAPKIASFFGVDYKGAEILSLDVRPPSPDLSIPRSYDAIKANLPTLLAKPESTRSRLSSGVRLERQMRSFLHLLRNRIS